MGMGQLDIVVGPVIAKYLDHISTFWRLRDIVHGENCLSLTHVATLVQGTCFHLL
jgi:hypothetical protein